MSQRVRSCQHSHERKGCKVNTLRSAASRRTRLTSALTMLLLSSLALVGACAPRIAVRIEDSTAAGDPLNVPGLRRFLDDSKPTPLHVVLVHGMGQGALPTAASDEATGDPPCIGRGTGPYQSTMQDLLPSLLSRLGAEDDCVQIAAQRSYGGVRHYRSHTISLGPDCPVDAPIELPEGTNCSRIVFHELNYASYFVFDDSNPYSLPGGAAVGQVEDKSHLFWNDVLLTEHAVGLNRRLKAQLVTWGLADATTYLDPYKRQEITNQMSVALLNIAWDAGSGGSPLVFLTRSLGSKVLFDSLARLYDLHYKPEDPNRSGQPPLLENTHAVFMLANQLPLLELGTTFDRDPAQRGEWLHRWMEVSGGASERVAIEPKELYLVALSDPNDPLTFRIAPTVRQYTSNPFGETETIKLIGADISVPIGTNWFNLFVDPVEAHSGHLRNELVLSILVDGWLD